MQSSHPLISICIPTHHGRRGVLSELLSGIIDQAQDGPGLVEICVSDNASRDGTAELVEELARHPPCPVLYKRHREDLGLARNLMAAVELARGRYCWLLGSDDLLADGALRRASELLTELPNATGYVVGATHVDAENPDLRSRPLARAFHPPGERPCLIEGLDRVYNECGNSWCALSWTIVERDVWIRAARQNIDLVLANPIFPQVVILAAVAQERPCWGWLVEPLVRQRNATTFLFERGEVPLADRWSQIIGGVAAVWGAVLGRRRGVRWRRRMRLLHEVWGGVEDMRATKLYDDPTLRSQARLALVCLSAFWPVYAYWRHVLPATLTPVWLTRARYTADGRWPAGMGGPAAEQLTLSVHLPSRMCAGSTVRVQVVVSNDAWRTVPSAGPNAVTVGQRWFTADGYRELEQSELGLNEVAAMPQSLPRAIHARNAVQTEMMLYAPCEPGAYRLQIAAHRHGTGWFDAGGCQAEIVEVLP